jgi:putative ABC transport system permease protein
LLWPRFVAKNAFRNERRSVLTILSVGFSMLLLTIMMAVWRSFYIDQLGAESALRLIVRPRVSSYLMLSLPSYYQEKIMVVPGVVNVTPCNLFAGLYKNDNSENTFAQIGTDSHTFLKVHPDYEIPQDQVVAWQKDRAGTIVDSQLAKKYGWIPGDRVVVRGSIFPVNLELNIRGIFKTPIPTQAIIFDWQYVEEAVRETKGRDNMFLVLADSPQSVSRVANAVDALFRNSTVPTKTETEKAFELDFISMLGNVKAFILGICGAVLFATLLVSANTMAMSIRERTREVAVLKALGYPRRTILGLFVGEAITLSMTGGVLGSSTAYGLLYAIAHSAQGQLYGGVLKITPPTLVLVLLVSVFVGFLSAAIPSYRASRANIVEGLRHIG